jgi:lipoate-protein ligase A
MSAFDPGTWRLILSEPLSGPANMARDEAILESVGAEQEPPTLRLYAWQPPCLSLGYAQPVGDVDHEALTKAGWDLVRRPTGGRAILHTDELTYAVIAPADHPDLRGGVLESYRRLSQGLIAALKALGLQVDPVRADPLHGEERENPVCFEAPSAYEITVDGLKLIGSAQVRRRDGILQHGSLPLGGDLSRICVALRYDSAPVRAAARVRVLERAGTLERLLERPVRWSEAAQALQAGFQQALGWKFEKAELSQPERMRSDAIEIERYRNPDWTERV